MNIVITGKDVKKTKFIGDTSKLPVPKIGEKVWVGYVPAPIVLDVIYWYEINQVTIVVDGIILE